MRLPRGRRPFDPKPLELIENLKHKVERRPDAGQGVIKDGMDVYGCRPEELLGDSIGDDDGRLFFFTPMKDRKGNGRDRSTPDRRWHAKKKTQIRNGEGSPVGYEREFYHHHGKKKPERTCTKWRMKEYTLRDDQPKTALCVIYRNKSKDRIQGNELRMEPLERQEAIASESEDARLHYPPNDSSSWGKATEDECRRYIESVAEKAGERCDEILFKASKLLTAGAPKFGKPERRVGPSEGGGFFALGSSAVHCRGSALGLFSSKEEEGFLFAHATGVGGLSGGDGHPGFGVKRDMDLSELMHIYFPSQESPTVHADAAFKVGGLPEAAAYPDVLPNTNAPEMLRNSSIFGCGETDGFGRYNQKN